MHEVRDDLQQQAAGSRARRTVPVVASVGTTTVRLVPSAATLAALTWLQ